MSYDGLTRIYKCPHILLRNDLSYLWLYTGPPLLLQEQQYNRSIFGNILNYAFNLKKFFPCCLICLIQAGLPQIRVLIRSVTEFFWIFLKNVLGVSDL